MDTLVSSRFQCLKNEIYLNGVYFKFVSQKQLSRAALKCFVYILATS